MKAELAHSDVLLVVIGPRWLEVEGEKYTRSVDDPEDYPRAEIITALQRKIPVIPILLNGAKIPRVGQLPADLKELSFQNGREIRHASFPSDVARLAHELKQIPTKGRELPPEVETPPKADVEALPKTTFEWITGEIISWLVGIAMAVGMTWLGLFLLSMFRPTPSLFELFRKIIPFFPR